MAKLPRNENGVETNSNGNQDQTSSNIAKHMNGHSDSSNETKHLMKKSEYEAQLSHVQDKVNVSGCFFFKN